MSSSPSNPPNKSPSLVFKTENPSSPVNAYQKSMEAGIKEKWRIEFMSKAFGITYTQQSLPKSTPTSRKSSKMLSEVEWNNYVDICENWAIVSFRIGGGEGLILYY